MANYQFGNLRERDMDMLFLEAISTDPGFVKLVLSRTKFYEKQANVVDVELSKIETHLGESDITVIFESNGERFGVLIEDKISAVAMEEQYARYIRRGETAVKRGDYSDFDIMIFCPEKYRELNNEAKKYPNFLSYELCKGYFDKKEDEISKVKSSQFAQAIENAKKPPEVIQNEAAIAFSEQYRKYMQANYPELKLRTKSTSNGYWMHYLTRLGNVFIYHKIQEGFIDLTFPAAAVRKHMDNLDRLADWLRKHGITNVYATETGKSGVLRIEVPKLQMTADFFDTKENDLKACFAALQSLSELANLIADTAVAGGLK